MVASATRCTPAICIDVRKNSFVAQFIPAENKLSSIVVSRTGGTAIVNTVAKPQALAVSCGDAGAKR
jgi:hypothetical protein